jgi:hypothetical protein
MMAGAVLTGAVAGALRALPLPGGVHNGAAVHAAFPHAVVEAGPESDWSHKSGTGREVRLALRIADRAPGAARLHMLMGAAEAAVMAVGPDLPGWRVVTLHFVRSQVARSSAGWTGVAEFRARMLAAS